jgi:RHS repeat-associated protein
VGKQAYSKIAFVWARVWAAILRLPCRAALEDGRAGSVSMSLELFGTFSFKRKSTEEKNMNGRLYDPVIARFFSPDNYVQIPEFTQAFNRYSYCLNNPLKYVDPSGDRFLECLDWIRDKDGTVQYDPNITKNSVLQKGQTYLGETYSEKGAEYRSDGSILFSKESAAISRMIDQSKRNGYESFAALTNNGTLVLPDYFKQGSSYDMAKYGYDTKNGNVVDGSGNAFNTIATAHTHLDGSGPSYYTGRDYGDLGFASFGTPNKPVYVLQMNAQKNVSYILASPNTTMKVSDFNYRINTFSNVNTDNLRNGTFGLGTYTKQTNFLQLLKR